MFPINYTIAKQNNNDKKNRETLDILDFFAIVFGFLLCTIQSLHRCLGHTAWAPEFCNLVDHEFENSWLALPRILMSLASNLSSKQVDWPRKVG